MRTQQAQLLNRIEGLSHDDADAVCLSLELIPREQIFDRSIKPKEVLLRYTRRMSTREEFESIERAINNLRR